MKQEDVNIEVVSIDDLIQDDHNFNKGNEQLYARGRLTQGLRHRCMILFLLEQEFHELNELLRLAVLMWA